MKKKVGIIGFGFTGTMLASHLIDKSDFPFELIIVDKLENFNVGVAFKTYSNEHILNVVAGKMSAYKDDPSHFVKWLGETRWIEAEGIDIKDRFLSRNVYGKYIQSIWEKSENEAIVKNIKIKTFHDLVDSFDLEKDGSTTIFLKQGEIISVDYCIIATGNNSPLNLEIGNASFYRNENYFQNPWNKEVVENLRDDHPVLIIGNGLSMIDTLLGLLEKQYKGKIISISPNGNGLRFIPNIPNDSEYLELTNELDSEIDLLSVIKLLKKHFLKNSDSEITKRLIIDSLRPHAKRIWRGFNNRDKQIFLRYFKSIWNYLRHRVPLDVYRKINQLHDEKRLEIKSGKILDFIENDSFIEVKYFDKKNGKEETINVSRVINCTGPGADFMKYEENILKKAKEKGYLSQDDLKLGIKTNIENYRIINSFEANNLFTLGINLKGEIFESTAVAELRAQAEQCANEIVKCIQNDVTEKMLDYNSYLK